MIYISGYTGISSTHKAKFVTNNCAISSENLVRKNNSRKVSFKGTNNLLVLQKVMAWVNDLPIKLCKYDNKEFKLARKECLNAAKKHPQTALIHTPEREKLRAEIIENYFKNQDGVTKNKNFYLVLGLPACGKSTLSKDLARDFNALNVNQDDIRAQLPEFKNNNRFEYVVLDEATAIRNKILDSAIENGSNVVLENIGIYKKDVEKLLNRFKNGGYHLHLFMVDLPSQKAAERNYIRFKNTNKFVEPLIHALFPKAPAKNFKTIIKENKYDLSDFAMYSSDVPQKMPYKIVMKKDSQT